MICLSKSGTSPRMRGKHEHRNSCFKYNRNIPAHAGKTHRSRTGYRYRPGTSPRMRGKLRGIFCTDERYRNIPAHAGKTQLSRSDHDPPEEHPRACGENYVGFIELLNFSGTSPRMRGKQNPGFTVISVGRNIPAYAGKTECCGDQLWP